MSSKLRGSCPSWRYMTRAAWGLLRVIRGQHDTAVVRSNAHGSGRGGPTQHQGALYRTSVDRPTPSGFPRGPRGRSSGLQPLDSAPRLGRILAGWRAGVSSSAHVAGTRQRGSSSRKWSGWLRRALLSRYSSRRSRWTLASKHLDPPPWMVREAVVLPRLCYMCS